MKSIGPDETESRAIPRYLLGTLLGIGALSALGGGYYGLCGAKGMPLELLRGSPFHDYFVPSLVLFFIVGGSLLLASVGVLVRFSFGRPAAFWAGWVLLFWITAQISIIGCVSWLQPVTATAALGVIVLARLLPQPLARPKG